MANLDISLDDRIKQNQATRAAPAPNHGGGPARRYPNRGNNTRAAPYSFPYGQHNTFGGGAVYAAPFRVGEGAARVIETGIKLLVSNLDYGVTDEDIQELFSAFGNLKKCSVNYDISGRSEGTAEVVFSRRKDAEAAIKSYNNVQLDGRAMKIEIVGVNMAPPLVPPAPYAGYTNYAGGPIRNGRAQGRGGPARQFQGGVRNPRMGRGGARRPNENISAEDLDSDLDKYLAEAKQAS